MSLTPREKQIFDLIQHNPLLSVEEIANTLAMSRASASVHLSNLSKKGWLLGRGFIVRESQNVVVIGGANMDFKHHLFESATLETSNPGSTQSAAGGVGRNIAQNLAQLGVNTQLLSVIGLDATGEQLIRETSATGVKLEHIKRSQTHTGTYSAILEPSGELVVAVAAMDILNELSPAYLQSKQPVLEHTSLIVIDSNIPEASLSMMTELASERNWQLIIEPVSVPKARKLRSVLTTNANIHTITPNQDELAVLVKQSLNSDQDLLNACQDLHAKNIENVWVSLGARGSLLSSKNGTNHFIPALKTQVQDITGAGDAALAGYLYAILQDATLEQACHYGHAAAALTVSTSHTVNPELTAQRLKEKLNG